MLSPASTLIKLISSTNRISASSTLVASVEKIADFHQQIIWKPLKPHSFTRKQRGCQLKKLFFSSENAGFIKKHHQHLELNGIPIPIGSMVLVYMLTWLGYIDRIHVTIYSSTMDPSWDMRFHPGSVQRQNAEKSEPHTDLLTYKPGLPGGPGFVLVIPGWSRSLQGENPNIMGISMWGPVIRWLINPMNTIVIGTINHSYWSYKQT